MKTIDLFLIYLKYLSKWNKSASLISIICSIEKGHFSDIGEIADISEWEYSDTKELTNDYVLSMEEVMNLIIERNRDKKIENILNGNF